MSTSSQCDCMAGNRADILQEDIDCLHMCLDDFGVPRDDGHGNTYSMWGRVIKFSEKQLAQSVQLGII